MKPKNFPARKNARRVMALENLLASPNNVAFEIRNLNNKITDFSTARAVRTKKYRGGSR